MFKKPLNKRILETAQTLREDWRLVVYYIFMSVTVVVAIAYCTLHAIGNELAGCFFFKAYLVFFITSIATWFFMRESAAMAVTAAKNSYQACKSANADKRAAEEEVFKLRAKVSAYEKKFTEQEEELQKLRIWKERSIKANRALSNELRTAQNTIRRLSAIKVVSVKFASDTPGTSGTEIKADAAPAEDNVSDIDAIFSVMKK